MLRRNIIADLHEVRDTMVKAKAKPERKILPIEFKPKDYAAIMAKARSKGLPASTWIKMIIFTHPEGVKPTQED